MCVNFFIPFSEMSGDAGELPEGSGEHQFRDSLPAERVCPDESEAPEQTGCQGRAVAVCWRYGRVRGNDHVRIPSKVVGQKIHHDLIFRTIVETPVTDQEFLTQLLALEQKITFLKEQSFRGNRLFNEKVAEEKVINQFSRISLLRRRARRGREAEDQGDLQDP